MNSCFKNNAQFFIRHASRCCMLTTNDFYRGFILCLYQFFVCLDSRLLILPCQEKPWDQGHHICRPGGGWDPSLSYSWGCHPRLAQEMVLQPPLGSPCTRGYPFEPPHRCAPQPGAQLSEEDRQVSITPLTSFIS